ncbi:hypothetical protein E2C01_005443 [Portunus trituberculatus]|uniref:Uncharacterized protein n=1 Tax=Portunus trituberculatus TaxID=210409 RepID=A0A5B7CUE9_PORTR|nr:hypothetical protein [Portunus trituberculatus]
MSRPGFSPFEALSVSSSDTSALNDGWCVHMCIMYLPSCSFTGPGLYARVAPSPYLHLSYFSLKLCTLIADTTSSLKLFQ